MQIRARFLLGVCSVMASVAAVWADDSAMNDGAFGPEPLGGFGGKESIIAMTSEHLEFKMGRQFTEVTARFTFRSAKPGSPAKQIVGFPDVGAAVEESQRRDPSEQASWHNHDNTAGVLQELRTFLDGAEVKSKLKYDYIKTGADGAWQAATPQTGYLMAWHVVPVSFPPGRDVVIERKYRTANGSAVYGITSFAYITHTGSNWRGPIGELTADVEFRDGLSIKDLAWNDASLPKFQKISSWFSQPDRSEWTVPDSTHMHLVWRDFEPRDQVNRRAIILMTKATQRVEDD